MINENKAKRYCSEDIFLIENYNKAISDKDKMWDIHHKRECDENGKTLFTYKQLIDMNLYFKRPAKELIFVTRPTHLKIHREIREKGWNKSALNLSIPILQFTKDGTFIKEWQSAVEAQRKLRIWQQHICACCKGKRKTAGGFVWSYKDPPIIKIYGK